jgi:WD40 repeat protein
MNSLVRCLRLVLVAATCLRVAFDVKAQTNPVVIWTASGHSNGVAGLAVSADGSLVASASWDGTVRLWNAADGSSRGILSNPSARVSAVAFSPDGRLLASLSDDQVLRLWSVASRTLITNIVGVARSLGSQNSVVFSPDGALMAAGLGGTNGVGLWRASDGSRVGTLLGGGSGTEWIAFSPDGALLAAAGGYRGIDATIKVWRVVNRALIKAIPTSNEYGVRQLAFSPDGAFLASGAEPNASFPAAVEIWRGSDWTRLDRIPIQGRHLAFSPDGTVLAISRGDSVGRGIAVDLWHVPGANLVRSLTDLTPDTGLVGPVVFSPDGSRIFVGGYISRNTVNGIMFQGLVSAVSAPTIITAFEVRMGQITIALSGGSGRYQLQRSTDLRDNWTNVGETVSVRRLSISTSGPRAFFRAVEITE